VFYLPPKVLVYAVHGQGELFGGTPAHDDRVIGTFVGIGGYEQGIAPFPTGGEHVADDRE
jgi:hypothetical protein